MSYQKTLSARVLEDVIPYILAVPAARENWHDPVAANALKAIMTTEDKKETDLFDRP